MAHRDILLRCGIWLPSEHAVLLSTRLHERAILTGAVIATKPKFTDVAAKGRESNLVRTLEKWLR